MNLTIEQIRVMIYYDYKKQLSQDECLESLHKTFGDSCVSRATVYNWFAEFSRGRDHFEDKPCASRPRTAVTPENIEAVRELVNIDPHITCQQIEDTLQIGSASTEIILHDYLGLQKLHVKFNGGKSKRVYDIITGDESWFYYYDPQTKRQSQVWVASNDPHPTKSGFNTIISLENGKTVTAKWYANECLIQVLKQVEKHRRFNGLLIHYDNAPAHKAALTMEYLDTQHVKLMGHPTYSTDRSP
ncbi:unnamed protein product [Rotaria sp. Silwood1]|nr:unnamed protein product [Rotaria sp. Silwood1]CAF1632970.1 unnamed protein product [Rotaria sp. Silwood1]